MIETDFKESNIGLIPKDWKEKLLCEIGKFAKGKGISRAEANTGVIPAGMVNYIRIITII